MMISVGTPLPLEGAYNVRDLGGYLTSAQRPVQKKRYLRGASLSRLTPGDREFLLRYGLSAVIDLRSPFEAQRDPDPGLRRSRLFLSPAGQFEFPGLSGGSP